MDNLTNPATNQVSDADGLVCSPEFTAGCANPQKGMPPELAPGAPIPEVQSRPEPIAVPDAGDEPMPVLTHNATDEPEQGFPEIACSAEFPKGCVDPSDATP